MLPLLFFLAFAQDPRQLSSTPVSPKFLLRATLIPQGAERPLLDLRLVSRANPNLWYSLARQPVCGRDDPKFETFRATAQEFVLVCHHEKANDATLEIFRYHLPSKTQQAHSTHDLYRARLIPGAIHFFTRQQSFRITGPPFVTGPRAAGHARATPPLQGRLHQTHNGQRWFANTFYAGEGHTGRGAFGFTDLVTKQTQTFTPPEVIPHSACALFVEDDAVWLALCDRGEWGDIPRGLLRFDRATQRLEKFPVPDLIHGLRRQGPHLLLATHTGLATLENTQLTRYFFHPLERQVVPLTPSLERSISEILLFYP